MKKRRGLAAILSAMMCIWAVVPVYAEELGSVLPAEDVSNVSEIESEEPSDKIDGPVDSDSADTNYVREDAAFISENEIDNTDDDVMIESSEAANEDDSGSGDTDDVSSIEDTDIAINNADTIGDIEEVGLVNEQYPSEKEFLTDEESFSSNDWYEWDASTGTLTLKGQLPFLNNSYAYKAGIDNELVRIIIIKPNTKADRMAGAFKYNKNLEKIVGLSNLDTSKVTDMCNMFGGCTSLTSLDLSNFDTSKVTNMAEMFYGCTSLSSLDLSRFDTSNVESMSEMFRGCSLLTSLDLSSFDTSKVTDMKFMFSGCSSLTSLDLSSFDVSNTRCMGSMFYGCSSLKNLDLSKFHASKVGDSPKKSYSFVMDSMFEGCTSLSSLDLSTFNTSNVESMYNMFKGCSSLTSLDVSSFDTSNVVRIDNIFEDCSSLTSLDLSSFDTSNVETMYDMFRGCSSLTSLDLSTFDTSSVVRMENMFEGCSSLTSLDLSSFDTSNVETMYYMFGGCTSLKSLDLSRFNTSNVMNMGGMFFGCSSLTSLDLSSFNTINVNTMHFMFKGCSSLKSIDLSSFDTTNVANMNSMFDGCSSLTYLGLSSFDTSSVNDMEYMFEKCSSLSSLELSNFDTSKVRTMYHMFYGCSSLTCLDLSGFDMSSIDDSYYGFVGFANHCISDCTSLKTLILPDFDPSQGRIGNLYTCTNLEILDLSAIDISNISDMAWYIISCKNLDHVHLPNGSNYDDLNKSGYGKIPSTITVSILTEDGHCSSEICPLGMSQEYLKYNAKITSYKDPIAVGDTIIIKSLLYKEDALVHLSDVKGLTYTVESSDPERLAVDSERLDLDSEVFITATAKEPGETTITVTYSNGVVAESKISIKATDQRYDKISLMCSPERPYFIYYSDKEMFENNSQEINIKFYYNEVVVPSSIDNNMCVNIQKIVIKAKKSNILKINGKSSEEFIPIGEKIDPTQSYSYSFSLDCPNQELIMDDTLEQTIIIQLYGDNDLVKSFELPVKIKKTASGSGNITLPDDVIIISENVSGDIVVNDGDYVVIQNKYGRSYKTTISCNNVIVNGGTLFISDLATLNVSQNVTVSGGNTNWLNPLSTDEPGGTLIVNGVLNIGNDLKILKPCGLMEMTRSTSKATVKNDFLITTDSTKYTCRFTDGELFIGRNFESSGNYGGNFQATGNHVTVFTFEETQGDPYFEIKFKNKNESYFNDLSFTSSAKEHFGGTVYTSNVKGGFYEYGNRSVELNKLLADYEPVVSKIVGAYSKYTENSRFKNDMSGLKKFIDNEDYFDAIVADTMMFCELENLAISTGKSESGVDILGPWRNYLEAEDNLAGATGIFANGKTVLSFSMNNCPNVYICLAWIGSSLGSTKAGASSATVFSLRWIVEQEDKYYANERIITLSFKDLNGLYAQLIQVYKDSTHTNGTVGDFISWFKNYVLKTYKDINDLYNGLTFQEGDLDLSKPKNITEMCDKLYKTVKNKKLSSFFFKIDDPYDAANLPPTIQEYFKSDMKAKDLVALITCPVDVEVSNSNGDIVASVINNKVVVTTDEVDISVINGDQKQCVFHSLDDFKIKITATDSGTMSYYLYELENGEKTRTLAFQELPLSEDTVYTGNINDYEKKTRDYFALKDDQGKVYEADIDTDIAAPAKPSVIIKTAFGGRTVQLNCADTDAEIYYQFGSSNITTACEHVKAGETIFLDEPMTGNRAAMYFKAYKNGKWSVLGKWGVLNVQIAQPLLKLRGNKYKGNFFIYTQTKNSYIVYTLDGSIPSIEEGTQKLKVKNGSLIWGTQGNINVPYGCAVKAIAIRCGLVTSDVMTYTNR